MKKGVYGLFNLLNISYKKMMIVKNPKFEISAVKPAQYPQNELPQIVLVGKSNVGKSSFINSMLNRKKLARTSSEPGKTRQINFYNIDEKFYFVDLPGYGYSKMSKEEQARVGSFIEEYLSKSDKIALIVFLIDIRHEPSPNDRLMYNYIINTNSPCLVIANKADKIAVTFMPFSSERKIYSEDVWNFIEKYI